MFDELLENPEVPITIQYTFMKKDGDKIFLEVTGGTFWRIQPLMAIILNSQDITERKRAEKEERMRSKMQALSENSPDMIIRLNTAGQFFYSNPMVEQYLGISPKGFDKSNPELNDYKPCPSEFFKDAMKNIKTNKAKG
jgi:PAS domain-containing protein